MYNKEITIRGYNNGYQYFIDAEHPLATGNLGRVYLHRHNASIKIGRWLEKDDVVHHIDHNKDNNYLANLQILTNLEHTTLHRGLCIDKSCSVCGCIFTQTALDQKFCSQKCSSSAQVKNKSITKEMLDELIPKHSWVSLGKLLGYLDNGIKKRAKALGCKV